MTTIDTIVKDAVFDIVLQGVLNSSSYGINVFLSRVWPGISINEPEYANAWSPQNLNGSQFATEKFSELVNNIPPLSQNYFNSGRRVEEQYGQVVQFATPSSGDGISADRQSELVDGLARALQEARRLFETSSLASLRDPAIKYHPSYTIPDNWVEQNASGSWPSVVQPIQVDNSSVNLSLKYLSVSIIRPWLMISLFDLPNWTLPSEPGSLSNGNTDNNQGSFALLPVSMLVVRDIMAVDASGKTLYQDQRLQTLAFINKVIPFSPPLIFKWIGKTETELSNNLSELNGTSLIIKIENYTNVGLQKIYEDKKYGIYKDTPLSKVRANSAQGFSTYQELMSGPEGWLVYSFDEQYNIILYWQNFWSEKNKGCMSFIPKNISLGRKSLERYTQQENIVRVQGNFICDARIQGGFTKAIFSYTIMPELFYYQK
ncbi:MAG: hypothetical protein V7L29_30065 [Nostoc sp.]|uniref:hypothetical protein n=1 Tax=Nostoc sp. TaxID=1180 RepID=UPI002FFC3A10